MFLPNRTPDVTTAPPGWQEPFEPDAGASGGVVPRRSGVRAEHAPYAPPGEHARTSPTRRAASRWESRRVALCRSRNGVRAEHAPYAPPAEHSRSSPTRRAASRWESRRVALCRSRSGVRAEHAPYAPPAEHARSSPTRRAASRWESRRVALCRSRSGVRAEHAPYAPPAEHARSSPTRERRVALCCEEAACVQSTHPTHRPPSTAVRARRGSVGWRCAATKRRACRARTLR